MAYSHKQIGFLFMMMMAFLKALAAEEYTVDWTTAGGVDHNNTHNFRQGDTLRFVHQQGHGVLQVSRREFGQCKTDFPMRNAGTTTGEHTIMHLRHTGDHYFISRSPDMCVKGMKLRTVSRRSRSRSSSRSKRHHHHHHRHHHHHHQHSNCSGHHHHHQNCSGHHSDASAPPPLSLYTHLAFSTFISYIIFQRHN